MTQPQSVTIEATIIRADGKVEPLGTVAYWHKNPLKRLAARIRGVQGKIKVTHAGSRPSS